MRTVLAPAMLETLGRNRSRNIPRVRAFETGTVFSQNPEDPAGLPVERDSLCLGLYGDRLVVGQGTRGGWIPFGPERLITASAVAAASLRL